MRVCLFMRFWVNNTGMILYDYDKHIVVVNTSNSNTGTLNMNIMARQWCFLISDLSRHNKCRVNTKEKQRKLRKYIRKRGGLMYKQGIYCLKHLNGLSYCYAMHNEFRNTWGWADVFQLKRVSLVCEHVYLCVFLCLMKGSTVKV